MQSIQSIKTYIKQQNITYQQLSDKSGIPLNTLKNIFRGKTRNPRIDTLQAIERALGLAPTFTEEEIAQGVGNHAVVLSDRDKTRLNLLWDYDKVLGEEYVDTYINALKLVIQQKKSK